MITLDAIALLDAIDRHGSFAAAAHALYRVPSAVTHAVRRLEAELGVPVFERAGRRARLTAAGRALLDDGRPLLAAARTLEQRARGIAGGWERRLVIAVDALIPAPALFPDIAAFQAAGHATELRLTCEVLAGAWDALLDGRADLAVGAPGDLPPGGGLSTRPLHAVEFVFAIAPFHPLATEPEPLGPETLRQHRAVVLGDTSRQLAPRSSGLLAGQPVLAVPDVAAKVAAQVAGLGVGHLPWRLAAPEIAAGRLVRRRTVEPRPPVPLHLAWPTRHRGKALAWFVERLDRPEARARLAES